MRIINCVAFAVNKGVDTEAGGCEGFDIDVGARGSLRSVGRKKASFSLIRFDSVSLLLLLADYYFRLVSSRLVFCLTPSLCL